MAPARVLYLLPTLATGGMERIVRLLATHLDRERFTPEVQLFDRCGAEAPAPGIPVRFDRRLPKFLDLQLVRTFASRWADDPPDVIHAHNSTALVYATLAARRLPIPIVYTEHGRGPWTPLHDRLLHAIAARRVDRAVAVARWLREWLVRKELFAPSRVEVVPNGIDGSPFGTSRVEDVRRDLAIPEDAPVAGCVARLVEVKNHAGLLGAWRRVVAAEPRALLLLIGDGPKRASLERLTDDLGLCASVRFLGDRSDVPRLFQAIDFHVLASRSEGMSVTLLEAMASARASVATAVGGNPDVLDHGRTGFLAGDGDALVTSLLALVRDRSLAMRMGLEARHEFERRFTVGAMVASYERIYREAIDRRASLPRRLLAPLPPRPSSSAP